MKVLKLSTSWCPPCRALAPVFEKVSKSKEFNSIEFIALDVEQEQDNELVKKFQVRSVPTLYILDDNDEVIGTARGYHSEEQLKQFIKENIKANE